VHLKEAHLLSENPYNKVAKNLEKSTGI